MDEWTRVPTHHAPRTSSLFPLPSSPPFFLRMPYLTSLLLVLTLAGCAKPATKTPPAPVNPFPGDGLSGKIAVFPLNTLNVDSALGWSGMLSNRTQFRSRVDSLLNELLRDRFP